MVCSICGAEFSETGSDACEACGRKCCRECLKIRYFESGGAVEGKIPIEILCYECSHERSGR